MTDPNPERLSKGLPEGVSETDLYDGPKVVQMPSGKAAFVQEPSPEALVRPIPASTQKANELTEATRIAYGMAPPPPVTTAQIKREYPELITLALDVLAIKVHALLALLAAIVIWGGVVFEPELWRIVGAAAFSAFVFLPVMFVVWRAGLRGEGG